jgi:hypothetical protein
VTPVLRLAWLYADPDYPDLGVIACDGRNYFDCVLTVDRDQLERASAVVGDFARALPHGRGEFELGEWNDGTDGAVRVALRSDAVGHVVLSLDMKDRPEVLSGEWAACEARLHLLVEPAAIDAFVGALAGLAKGELDVMLSCR